jgi:hypothetical protein
MGKFLPAGAVTWHRAVRQPAHRGGLGRDLHPVITTLSIASCRPSEAIPKK